MPLDGFTALSSVKLITAPKHHQDDFKNKVNSPHFLAFQLSVSDIPCMHVCGLSSHFSLKTFSTLNLLDTRILGCSLEKVATTCWTTQVNVVALPALSGRDTTPCQVCHIELDWVCWHAFSTQWCWKEVALCMAKLWTAVLLSLEY